MGTSNNPQRPPSRSTQRTTAPHWQSNQALSEMLSVIASAQEVINRNSQIMERVERKLESIK